MCTTRRCSGNLMTRERKSMLTQILEKLRAWRNSPKLGQEGEVDEKYGWRDPLQLREQEVDTLLAALQAAPDTVAQSSEADECKETHAKSIDAVDAEVDGLINKFRWGIEAEATSRPLVDKLRDIAIARGQTRTDAVNKAAEWAKECDGLREQLREARKEIERLKESVDSRVPSLVARVATLTAERDEARKELAALKSAPGMREVDACIVTPEPYERGVTTVYGPVKYDGEKLADIARRSIASREEVVGLLRKLWWEIPVGAINLNRKWILRIIEIVEGK